MCPGRSGRRWPIWPATTRPWGGIWPRRSGPAATARTVLIRARRSPGTADPGPTARGLNKRAPRLNATWSGRRISRGRSRGARWRRSREVAAMLIHVWIEGRQPLAGTAAIEGREPVRFDGWLELLRVVSELVAAGPPGGDPNNTMRADARADPTTEERMHD